MTKHVLIVDDDPNLCLVLEAELCSREYQVSVLQSPEEALRRLEAGDVDVVLTDVNMQRLSGVELCARVVASGRDIPVVVMTAFGSMDSALAAIHAGAFDYVTKPLDMGALAATLDRGVRARSLRSQARWLREGHPEDSFEELVGSSPAMTKAYGLIDRVAKTDVTVLVTGESGSGKELVAKAIHSRGPRAGGPFIAINCAAMPEPLLESELFGHTRGAFTDAHQARKGLFLKASGGTLFLDEIGEMPAGMQAKLLRALQERRVRPVGGDTETPFDARIVAATHRDLEAEVAAKRFREDLFYRINVVRIDLPPLRARGRDILLLAQHILQRSQPGGRRIVGFTPAVLDALLSYPWPGNVRELQNCIQRGVALAEFDHLGLDDLPDTVRYFKGPPAAGEAACELIPAEELERRYIAQVLAAVGGNKAAAARILGFDRRTLSRKADASAERVAEPPRPPEDAATGARAAPTPLDAAVFPS
ncbi:MAG: sigma-54 dependent transcriptional regulator [Myxococcota bacterium]|nr:sigma-54 dependent transcriptional regulator [Myxococcota bacterium]